MRIRGDMPIWMGNLSGFLVDEYQTHLLFCTTKKTNQKSKQKKKDKRRKKYMVKMEDKPAAPLDSAAMGTMSKTNGSSSCLAIATRSNSVLG